MEIFRKQFWDPAIEEVHEKWMREMHMGNDPVHIYFCRLEQEAKLANQRTDKSDRGTLVHAIYQGIPPGYTLIIANIGIGVPCNYQEWKDCVLWMYKEHQKKLVYDQAHRSDQRGDKRYLGNQKQITATSSNKNTTGGVTSSLVGKMTSDGKGHDNRGQWVTMKGTTYGGAGEPMQIDAKKQKQCSEG